jgi:hypothetical protein
MKPPLVLDNRGDLRFFRALQDAEAYAEPIDVRNREYIGYDSEGRLLSITVVLERLPGILGRLGSRHERVMISTDEETPRHAENLRKVLIAFLGRVGVDQQWLDAVSLDDLVQKGLELQGD